MRNSWPVNKKTSSFKYAAWSKGSILCIWRSSQLFNYVVYAVAMVALIPWLVGGVCWAAMLLFVLLLPWLRVRHFLCDWYGAWPWWMKSLVKQNMLKSPVCCSPQRITSPVLVDSCIRIANIVPVHVNHVCILFMCEGTRHIDEPFCNAPIAIEPVNCSTPHTMTTLTCRSFTISL